VSAALWTELRRSAESGSGSDGPAGLGRRQTLDDLLSPSTARLTSRSASETFAPFRSKDSLDDSGESIAARSIRELSVVVDDEEDDDAEFYFADDLQSEGDRASLGAEYLQMSEEEEVGMRVSEARVCAARFGGADAPATAYTRQIASLDQYFYGTIDRRGAEEALDGRSFGTFLVRVAETRIGYSLTCVLRSGDVQHFKICLKDEKFWIAGDEQIRFNSLEDLIGFYHSHQLTKHGDYLREPCE
jgi:hypothetical protein